MYLVDQSKTFAQVYLKKKVIPKTSVLKCELLLRDILYKFNSTMVVIIAQIAHAFATQSYKVNIEHLNIDEHLTVHITVHIAVSANIRFSYYALFIIMASKNHIYIYYLPAIRYTYLNLDAYVIFVPKRKIGDEFHYQLICPVLCNDHHHW